MAAARDFETFRAGLLRRARAWLEGQPYDPESLVQQTALRAIENAATFHGTSDGEYFAWLTVIMWREWLQRLRADGRHNPEINNHVDLPSAVQQLLHVSQLGTDPAQRAQDNERADLLTCCLEKLPPQQRLAVTYCYLMKHKQVEAAALMGIGAPALNRLLRRGLATLREWMENSSGTIRA